MDLLRRGGTTLSYRTGETVFDAGDEGDCIYVVASGTVALNQGDRKLESVGPSGIFGELALIDREPRSAAAVAETDCELVAIDKRRFWFLVQETPYFAEIVMRTMADRLRRAPFTAA